MKVVSHSFLQQKYQHFIVDVTGVVYNGMVKIASNVAALNRLIDVGKNVVFLSNSPLLQEDMEQRLIDYGMRGKFGVVTSGDFASADIDNGAVCPILKQPGYPIGSNIKRSVAAKLKFTRAMAKAWYVYAAHFFEENQPTDIFDQDLVAAIQYNLPMVCTNPDRIAVHGDSMRKPQGYLAQRYENMGGKIYYYGKPHLPIYRYVFAQYNIDPANCIAIGDYLYTDILGAQNAKIDSLLLLNGNHRNEKERCLQLIERGDISPTYIMEELNL